MKFQATIEIGSKSKQFSLQIDDEAAAAVAVGDAIGELQKFLKEHAQKPSTKTETGRTATTAAAAPTGAK